jgi:MoaA/NifB/PqqE/SkfB family radical SAM enzyme
MEDVKHIKHMPNLILTTECQRNCSYCFAKESMANYSEFNWDNFIVATEFISTGPKNINLIGGEPTLHKDFCKMLEYLLIDKFTVQVFTNGMVSSNTLNNIISVINKITLNERQLSFAVNVNEGIYRLKDESILQERFFDYLGKLSYPSFTIHDKSSNLLFLKDIVTKFNTDNVIKLNLAHPINNGKNKHLKITDYKHVAKNIISMIEDTPEIYKVFDCGFPLCMFSLDEISKLNKDKYNDFLFSCSNPLDIYPDLSVTNCFSLSKFSRKDISFFNNIDEAYKFFEDGFMTPSGVFGDICINCSFFRVLCSGGCKGFYKPKV